MKSNWLKLNSNSEPKLIFSPSVPRISASTHEALMHAQIFHRSETFHQLIDETSEMLLSILGCGNYTTILAAGSGTLANDIMLANFSVGTRCPLVLVNGEFGQRLLHQCSRYRSDTLVFDAGWGKRFDLVLLETYLKKKHEIDTIFFVAVETSVGMVNPVKKICELARRLGKQVGIDAISALGAVPIDYTSEAISCITGSSGKALLSIPGVLILFIRPKNFNTISGSIPHVLDLRSLLAARKSPGGVRNTLTSVLVYALHNAVADILNEGLSKCYRRGSLLKTHLLEQMKAISINPLANSDCPMVTSFERPNSIEWEKIRDYLKQRNLAVYDNSSYLEKRNIFQVATFGDYSLNEIFYLTNTLKDFLQST